METMESTSVEAQATCRAQKKRYKKFNLRYLRISLKYRPEILKLVLAMRKANRKKTVMLKKLRHNLKILASMCGIDLGSLEISYKSDNEEASTATEYPETKVDASGTESPSMDIDYKDISNKPDNKDTKSPVDNQESKNKDSTTESTLDSSIIGIQEMSQQTDEKDAKQPIENQEIKDDVTISDGKSIAVGKKTTKSRSSQTKRKIKHATTQTENINNEVTQNSQVNVTEKASNINNKVEPAGWSLGQGDGESKSIAEQVKEAAQSAMQQSGMVYVEAAGMYYDYKTGYYYHPELGLYYHQDTGCYYTYTDDKQFVFHSYPDQRAVAANANLLAHEKRKARKHKKEEDQATKPKRKKKENKKQKKTDKGDVDIDAETKVTVSETKNNDGEIKEKDANPSEEENNKVTEDLNKDSLDDESKKQSTDEVSKKEHENNYPQIEQNTDDSNKEVKDVTIEDVEDGECSETASEAEDSEAESDASVSTVSNDDVVAKHHPPCMRIIVRETSLPKLKVGSLYLVTKDGGTIGREGDHHTILLRDQNVSRNHLDIRYDMERRLYMATDVGSKNGTLLNGIQMSLSQVASQPMEVIHGSVLQLGETKLLCHIHAGNDTCGHCEPGLIMETIEKEKVAYTRTCSVKKQYQLELARLKNKYTPEPLMIEDGAYNDRAKARRETVGSSHHSEKTQSADVDTFIEPENKGFKLLQKMGWSKGEGLGKESQGETEPVPIVSNEGTAGLGTGAVGAPKPPPPKPRNKLGSSTLRLAARSKMLQPPAKAFLNALDDEEDE